MLHELQATDRTDNAFWALAACLSATPWTIQQIVRRPAARADVSADRSQSLPVAFAHYRAGHYADALPRLQKRPI